MVVDSCVWLEILLEGPKQELCERHLKKDSVYVPSLVLFELYKKIKSKVAEDVALEWVSYLSQFQVADMDRSVALLAADLALEYQLSMADSIVLSHSRLLNCPLITLDNDFSTIPGVTLIR
jgi:predicted nucleic acid-binding protein